MLSCLTDSSETISAIYSSDLLRCVQTATPAAEALGLQLATQADLRERNLGVLQGLVKQEAQVKEPTAWGTLLNGGSDARIPGGGESEEDLGSRVQKAVNEIAEAHPGGRVAVVTHGGVLAQVYKLATGHYSRSPSVNGSLHSILVDNGRWSLLSWGGTSHLEQGSYSKRAFGGGVDSG